MPSPWNKTQLHHAIEQALEALVANAQRAVERAYESATHEESKAENKYDTLGLEAAYLTEGQSRRLQDCKTDLERFRALKPKAFTEDDPIGLGALVMLADEQGHERALFLAPGAGGVKVTHAGQEVVVITPSAPLGQSLMNAYVGDHISVPKPYDIVAVY